jgi:membrane protease YdiL (CAAX protease family)
MDVESSASDRLPSLPAERAKPTVEQRTVAAVEVLLCSDFPTQLLIGATFAAFGFRPQAADGTLDITFVAVLSLADTVVLVGLILTFLVAHGERPQDVLLGGRPVWPEARAGVPMVLTALAIALVVLLSSRALAPWLRTVEHNPFQDLIRTPRDMAVFAVVVVVAGGVREELQRAFLLHRFERWLGGRGMGVVITSAAFGAGHLLQGADAVLATGLLGAFWAVVYLKRGSVVAPVVSHSGFNLLQLAQFMVVGR